jgi:hypothetical protein
MSKHDKQAQAEPVDEGPTITISADDMALLDADDGWGPPDPTILGEWLRDALDMYGNDIPIPPPRWTAVAARVEHIGTLARQLVDTAAELETLLTGTYTSTSILMSQEDVDGIAVRYTVGEQGLNVWDLAKHLKQQLRQPTEYLRLVLQARDLGRSGLLDRLREYLGQIELEHLAILRRAQDQEVAALIARLKAEAPLAAAVLLQRPDQHGGRPPVNWAWNKLMTKAAQFYEDRTLKPATVTKDAVTGEYKGQFFQFAVLIDRWAAQYTRTEPLKLATLGSRLERLLSSNRKDEEPIRKTSD